MNNVMESLAAIAVAIVGVAMVAVIVSRNSQTPAVITAAARGFSQSISAAVSPVTGGGIGFGSGGVVPGGFY